MNTTDVVNTLFLIVFVAHFTEMNLSAPLFDAEWLIYIINVEGFNNYIKGR